MAKSCFGAVRGETIRSAQSGLDEAYHAAAEVRGWFGGEHWDLKTEDSIG